MTNQNVHQLKKKALNPGIALITVGIVGILVFAFYDCVGLGKPGLGMVQLSGLIIGAIITATGLVKVLFPHSLLLLRALAGIYVAGILYVGLKPNSFKRVQYGALLDVSSFDWYDFAANTMAFIPLGYLFMLSFVNPQENQRANLFTRSIVAAVVGGLISLFLEFSQYFFIPGRESNLMDLIANTLGTLVGITMYIFGEQKETLDARIKGLRKPVGPSCRVDR